MGPNSKIYEFVESKDGQRFLANLFKTMLNRTDYSWEEVENASYGNNPLLAAGNDDFAGLQRGDLKKEKASAIFFWLLKTEPAWAEEVTDHLTNKPRRQSFEALNRTSKPEKIIRWQKFLQDQGTFGQVEVCLMNPTQAVTKPTQSVVLEAEEVSTQDFKFDIVPSVQPPDLNPISDVQVQLDEPFHFKFMPPVKDSMLAIQKAGHPWWEPMPINGGEPIMVMDKDTAILPSDENGTPLPLLENERTGRHHFAFIFANTDLIASVLNENNIDWQIESNTLNRLAQALNQTNGQFKILRLDVMFVK